MPTYADNSPNIKWPLPAVGEAVTKENFLSEQSFNELRDLIEDIPWGPGTDPKVNTYHTIPGRWVWGPSIPQHILDEITAKCRESFGVPDLKLTFTFMARYQPNGTVKPYLWEHMDQSSSQYLMDLCLELKGIDDWGVIVDDQVFSEKENSAVLFHGQQQTHARPKYPSDDPDSYNILMFAAFIRPGHWAWDHDFTKPPTQEYYDLIEKHRWDSEIRYYEYRGRSAQFIGLPEGNYECLDCMQCYVVPPDFVDHIEGYTHLDKHE